MTARAVATLVVVLGVLTLTGCARGSDPVEPTATETVTVTPTASPSNPLACVVVACLGSVTPYDVTPLVPPQTVTVYQPDWPTPTPLEIPSFSYPSMIDPTFGSDPS